MMKKHSVWVVLVVLVLMVGCQPRETELSFETVERRDWPGSGREWESREPGLRVIAASEDLVPVDALFTEDARAQLNQLDLNDYFVVAAFLGHYGSGHEGLEIKQVVRQGNRIAVHTQVGSPGPETVETSPYHLVTIRKEGNWNQTIHFTLYLDEEKVVSLSHFVP